MRYRIPKYLTVLQDGRPVRFHYSETDHCCEGFAQLDSWLESGRQRRGTVGHAQARLIRSRDVVAAALTRLQEDETVFLHPAGECEECDAARASLG